VWLVAGLGNPGEEYQHSPHNAGFLVVDRLAETHAIRVTRKEGKALVGIGSIAGRPVALAKPQTFMNLSGVSVKALLEKHEIAVANLIVIWDELNLPWGGLRVLGKGSAGGHNGAKSVIQSLGTQEFTRVRLGVNPGRPLHDGVEYLLSPLSRQHRKELEEAAVRAAEAVESIIAEGVEKSMTIYNRRAQGSKEEA
jgi:peptidyl-tRNA hydrolase, PTH1 family